MSEAEKAIPPAPPDDQKPDRRLNVAKLTIYAGRASFTEGPDYSPRDCLTRYSIKFDAILTIFLFIEIV